jgi:hypothetical protein
MAKKKVESLAEFHVHYGNVNVGDHSVRIGCTMDRKGLTLPQADKLLCGHRLTGSLYMFPQPAWVHG